MDINWQITVPDKQSVLNALAQVVATEAWGRMGFEKDGDSFTVWANSELEPDPTS